MAPSLTISTILMLLLGNTALAIAILFYLSWNSFIEAKELSLNLPDCSKKRLRMTKEQFLQTYTLKSGLPYDKIIVGAAIFHPYEERICLLKRNANKMYYPNVFELPGGNVNVTDSSILSALKRKVRQETGFEVAKVYHELEPFHYFTVKMIPGKLVKKSCVQINYVVFVQKTRRNRGEYIEVNPEEHSSSVWASYADLGQLWMTEEMKMVVSDALKWWKGWLRDW